jgi:spermidine synthase
VAHPERFEGSQADLYLQLADVGESQLVHFAVPNRASILELGSGTGRMTRGLLELGHFVTEAAETVLSDIETLVLEATYEVVLLASNLINNPEQTVRSKFLATCRRHISEEGVVILQRYQPDLEGWEPGDWVDRGPVAVRVSWSERHGDEFSASIQYRHEDQTWTHHFSAAILDDEKLRAELAHVGLRLEQTLNSEGTWILAAP